MERRRRVKLRYRKPAGDVSERLVDPYGYAWRRGHWLFVGHCHLRGQVRLFFLDRTERLTLAGGGPARGGDFPPPAGFDIRRWSRQEAWSFLVHGPREAAVRFGGGLARIAGQLLPEARFSRDGAARVAHLEVTNLAGLVRQVLAWGPEAELLEPAEGRAMARAILDDLAARLVRPSPRSEGQGGGVAVTARAARRPSGSASPRKVTSGPVAQLRRMLLLIPAAARAGEAGLPVKRALELTGLRDVRALTDLVASAGDFDLGPSLPEDFLHVTVENDRIFADRPLHLVRPPPLSLREGAALMAALRPFEGTGARGVAAALRKLRRAVPAPFQAEAEQLANAVDFQVAPPGPHAAALADAIERRVEVALEYRAEVDGAATVRGVEPRALFQQDAHWYLAAWNVAKAEEHLYRLDRVVDVVPGTRCFGAHKGPPLERYRTKHLYFQSGGERAVRVRFTGPSAASAPERRPEAAVERGDDGSVTLSFLVTPGNYLLGWVLGHGGEAEVTEPPEVRADLAARVEELRARYRDAPPAGAVAPH